MVEYAGTPYYNPFFLADQRKEIGRNKEKNRRSNKREEEEEEEENRIDILQVE